MILSTANLINKIITMITAEYKPNFPISPAIASNFSYNGVTSGFKFFKAKIYKYLLI